MNMFAVMRCRAGLTQEQVASSLQLNRSTVAKWETGDSSPRFQMFPILAKLYGCSIDDLFDYARQTDMRGKSMDGTALRFKELRIKFHKTQADVARYIGISRGAYANIENGKRDPDTKTLIKIATFFGVSVDSLLGVSFAHETPTRSENIGRNIKNKRLSLRLSQTALSRLSGISQSAISDIENPEVTKRPSTETIAKLAAAMKCSVAELMGEETIPPAGNSLSAQEEELINLFRDLNEKGRDWLMRSARMVHDDAECRKQDTSNMAI